MPRVFLRVCADQAIGSPLTICLTFAASGMLKGDPGGILPRISSELWPTWKNGASYWPFVHGVNFAVVPVHHNALVAHVMSVPWNAVLSYRSNKSLSTPDAGIGAAGRGSSGSSDDVGDGQVGPGQQVAVVATGPAAIQ